MDFVGICGIIFIKYARTIIKITFQGTSSKIGFHSENLSYVAPDLLILEVLICIGIFYTVLSRCVKYTFNSEKTYGWLIKISSFLNHNL